jgi:hypothetical protein
MRKLKLNAEDLQVSSFETSEQVEGCGTVAGHRLPPPSELSCEGVPTCEQQTHDANYYTCGYTCPASCYQGCYTQMTACGGCLPVD